ncbi:MAG: ribonuclease M5 [Erysipelotrichaceae bacterium]
MLIKETIVVEGIHDQSALSQVVKAHIIVTNGLHISPSTIELIAFHASTNGVIVLTDPDTPGKKIREKLSHIPNIKHVYLQSKDARHRNKVGVEYASSETLLDALQNVISNESVHSTLNLKDLMDLDLSYGDQSSNRRQSLIHHFHLCEGNAKAFIKQCQSLNISKEDIMKVLNHD